MGNKSKPSVAQVQGPSAEEIAAAQLNATRGQFELQKEFFPQFTELEGQRIAQLGPISAQSVADSQDILLKNLRTQFPDFFTALSGLGQETINRIENIGQLPQDVADQSIEQSLSAFSQRGISESPLAVAGTAGQLSALGQNQRAQDIGLAQAFLNGSFAPNVPLPGLPSGAFSPGTPGSLGGAAQFGALGTQASQLGAQIDFSNRALQMSNAQLGGMGGGFGQALAGAGAGAASGAMIGSIVPGLGTGAGALYGGIAGGLGGFF